MYMIKRRLPFNKINGVQAVIDSWQTGQRCPATKPASGRAASTELPHGAAYQEKG